MKISIKTLTASLGWLLADKKFHWEMLLYVYAMLPQLEVRNKVLYDSTYTG